MKYLIVLGLLGLLLWKWQSGRTSRPSRTPTPGKVKDAPAPGTPMQACLLCGLHVPQPDAVHSRSGWYCCEAHRQRAEA